MNSTFFSKRIGSFIAVVFFIILFGVTHLLNLGSVPKGLHADESSFLLNSYSLATTLKDEDGKKLPIWFDSLIDSKPALYSYLQIPFIKTLGTTTTASRMPAAILGGVSIFLVYWVLRFLLPKNHAVLATLFLITSPWHSMVSRSTQEVILAFVFSLIAIGSYFSVLSAKTTKLRFLWGTAFVCANILAMYSYHSAKVFLPTLFLGWSVLEVLVLGRFENTKESATTDKTKRLLHIGLSLGVLAAGVIITFAFAQSLERFKAVGFLSEKGPILIMEEQIRTASSATPILVMRVFYNKIVAYGLQVVAIYSQHFTIDFFFIKGGEPGRYQVPFHGLFYHIEMFLLPLGLFLGLHDRKNRRWAGYMLWWLLVAPLPAALTAAEVPSMIRAFPMVVPVLVFTAHALWWIWQKRTFLFTKVVILGIFACYVWGFAYFSHQLFIQQARYHPWNRNRSEEILASWLVEHASEYDRVHITTIRDLYMYIVLADPSLLPLLQTAASSQHNEEFLLTNYFFKDGGCGVLPYPPELKVLYVVRPGCQMKPGFIFVARLKHDDNAEAYDLYIYEYPPQKTSSMIYYNSV